MTKKFCDRCGKEIKRSILPRTKEIVFEFTMSKWGLDRRTYDICLDCSKAFLKFMNREDHFLCEAEAIEGK